MLERLRLTLAPLLHRAAGITAAGRGARWLAARRGAVTAVMLGERCLAARVEVDGSGLRLAAVAECARHELAQWQGLFSGSAGVLVLRAEERHLLVHDRPEVPDAELALAVRWPLAAALEAEPEALLTTVLALPQINDAQRPQVLGVAARLEVVRGHLDALAQARLPLRSIDVADSALRGMALLQPDDDDGWVVVALMGAGIAIGLLWHGEFCALRTLPLPPERQFAEADFEQRLALQIQRTADHFERQATQLSIRRVLAAVPSLRAASREIVRNALPLQPQLFEVGQALRMDEATRARCAGDDDLTALACVAVARLIDTGQARRPAPLKGDDEPRPQALAAALIGAAAQPGPARAAASPLPWSTAADPAPAEGRQRPETTA